MKYNYLKQEKLKSFKLPILSNGVDFKNSPWLLDDKSLSDCKNVWFKDGRLQTRPGVSAIAKWAHTVDKVSNYDEFEYRVTDTVFNFMENQYQIATAQLCANYNIYYVYVYLVSSNSNVMPFGNFTFFRFSSDDFKIPKNINFYVGKPQKGGGVFALITLENCENYSEQYYNVYEISADLTTWERVYDYYVPTILINGRGNNYETAYKENLISTPKPLALEAQNLLNGKFHAYYTSDGRSNMFRLPMANLSWDTIVCRINYTPSLYVEWEISGSSSVDTKKFMGVDILLEVDREKGTLSFKKNGEVYAPPVIPTYNENNIRVTATKIFEDGFQQVVDSSCCLETDGRIFLAGGQKGNVIVSAKYENPLYFPLKSTITIGNDEVINGLGVQNKKIIAFKNIETHAVTLKKGKRINEIGLLADNDTLFEDSDILTSEIISNSVGCMYNRTIRMVNGKLVWLGHDCNVYVLDSVGFNKIQKISDKIIRENRYNYFKSFGVTDGNYYFIIVRNNCYLCDCEDFNNPKWYLWEFSDKFKVCDGFFKWNTLFFLCSANDSSIFYIAPLEKETDTEMYYNEDGKIEAAPIKVESSINTKKYVLSNMNYKNIIESIHVALSGKGKVNIKVNGGNDITANLRFSADDYDKGEYKVITLLPHLYNTEKVDLNISSDSPFAVGDIEIFYRKIG